MKPELVFPVVLASYSEDKIARELLNNDSMIKIAGPGDFLRNVLKWLRFRRGTSVMPPSARSTAAPKAAPKAAPTAAQKNLPDIKPTDVPGAAKVEQSAERGLNVLKEIIQTNKLDIGEVEKALPLVSEFVENEKNIVKLPRSPQYKKQLVELLKRQSELSSKLQDIGFTSDNLKKIKSLDPDELKQVVAKGIQEAKTDQAAKTNQPADTAQLANAAQATKTDQPLDTTQNSNKESTWISDLINSLIIGGSVLGSGHQISQSLTKGENTNRQILRGLEQNARGPSASLTAPTDQRTESDQGDGPPKQQIPPLLAAGLGALLIGGLAQRRYGNEEGRYDSLGDSLLPMLAGGLVGYGGAEAINRYV
jgi:hypothetical protein